MCHGSDSLKCTDNETCWCFTGAAAFMVYFSSELLIFFLSRLPLIVYRGDAATGCSASELRDLILAQ